MKALPWLIPLLLFPTVQSEPISMIVGTVLVGGLGVGIGYLNKWKIPCVFDCCGDLRPIEEIEDTLRKGLQKRVYGQHLAVPMIYNAVLNHLQQPVPKKALSLAFHGVTGVGKNYAAHFIAEALFTKGMSSSNVHLISGNIKFFDEREIHDFRNSLQYWIRSNITSCTHTLFIFDEIDKLPVQVIDSILAFLEAHAKVQGVDPRRAIFIFLSNAGAELITQYTLRFHEQHKARDSISMIEMERMLQQSAFNQKDGGFKNSELISRQIIDYFIPFLPLTREHVLLCIRDYAERELIRLSEEEQEKIADSLSYFPPDNPVFASSGCRPVEKKVDMHRFRMAF